MQRSFLRRESQGERTCAEHTQRFASIDHCVARCWINSHMKPLTSRTKTFPAPLGCLIAFPPVDATVPPAFFHCSTAASISFTTIVNAGDPTSCAPITNLERGTPLYSIKPKSSVVPGILPCVI